MQILAVEGAGVRFLTLNCFLYYVCPLSELTRGGGHSNKKTFRTLALVRSDVHGVIFVRTSLLTCLNNPVNHSANCMYQLL
jgi:hypothetical protein